MIDDASKPVALHPELDRLLSRFFSGGLPMSFVDGRWVASSNRMDTFDPSVGHVSTTVPDCSGSEVAEAIELASTAQNLWEGLSLLERIDCLRSFASELSQAEDDLALLESIDTGNPMRATRRDMQFAQTYLREWPAVAQTQAGRATQPFADGLSYTLRRPYGVVGRIIAYNHPSLFAVAGMIYPLLAGNSIVIKAADQTPLATLALGAIARNSLPPGVLNLVSGGPAAGDALVTSPLIKRVSFVGSGRTAQIIQTRLSLGGMVKHFTAELGGKNAMVVCSDVDLDEAAEAAIAGMSLRISQGQSCQSTSRVLVHVDIFDEFVQRMAGLIEAMSVGPSYDETADMGPLVSKDHVEHVESYLGGALPAGSRVVVGGKRPSDCPPEGYYLEPTLVVGASPGSRIMEEEIFGPVVVAHPWTDEDEVVSLVNSSPLGLSAAIWSKDIDRALRLAHRVEVGYVWVNDANRHYAGAPFGGLKGSGVGREESVEELLSYSEVTAVNIRISPETRVGP